VGFNDKQLERYKRNILLCGVGEEGQQKLLDSKVLVVGTGGLGSPAGLYLAAAGVGAIGLVDADRVDMSNLQRQIIHSTGDLGAVKVESAKESINALNPGVRVETYNIRANAGNIGQVVSEYDFVVDCTDNFPAKFLLNDACWFEGKGFCHAGVLGYEGQMMTIIPGESACYRCVFDGPPEKGQVPDCSQVGVFGVLPGVIGTLQATEAIKYLLGIGELVTDSLLTYNALTMEFRKVTVKRNANCRLCGERPVITELFDEK